jgi:hypothetical protein
MARKKQGQGGEKPAAPQQGARQGPQEQPQEDHSIPSAVRPTGQQGRDGPQQPAHEPQHPPQPQPPQQGQAAARREAALARLDAELARREEDAAFNFEAKEWASDGGHQTTKGGAAAQDTEMADLLRLEAVMDEGEKKHREAVEALREVRDRKLFRKRGYDSFDDYVECHRRRTRQWATQEINWLRACECLEARGKGPYQFSKQAVQPAAYLLESDPEGFCEVYLGAAAKALPVTENAVKESLKDYLHFVQLRDEWARWQDNAKVPEAERAPVTKEEAELLDFPWERRSYATNLVEKAKEKAQQTGRTWQECLAEVCREERKTPMPVHLLAAARGDDLKEVVLPLRAELQRWEDYDRAAKVADELTKRAREIRRAYGIKPRSRNPKDSHPGSDGGESNSGDDAAGTDADGGQAKGAEDKTTPEPAEVVKAMEQACKAELSMAYLLQAGCKCWEVAFKRLDPTDPGDKEGALEPVEEMAALLEQFKGVDWA